LSLRLQALVLFNARGLPVSFQIAAHARKSLWHEGPKHARRVGPPD